MTNKTIVFSGSFSNTCQNDGNGSDLFFALTTKATSNLFCPFAGETSVRSKVFGSSTDDASPDFSARGESVCLVDQECPKDIEFRLDTLFDDVASGIVQVDNQIYGFKAIVCDGPPVCIF